MKDIDPLIKLFTESGGVFHNAEVRYSEDAGFYCYSLDCNKTSIISCPASLLVDVDHLDININGLFIKEPEKYGNNIGFLNKYFEFHFNKTVIERQITRKKQIESLSETDLSVIANIFPPELCNTKKHKGLEYEKKRIIDSHNSDYRGKKVIMPFVTFINYNKNAASYSKSESKISISGKFNGEIFAKYNDDDVLRLASGYDFITDTKFTYSIPLSYPMANGKKMIINRNPLEATEISNGRWKPHIKVEPDSITLSWFPLHMEGATIYPAVIAKIIADEAGIPAENLLYNVIRLNLQALIPAAFQLKSSENEFSRYLGAAAQRQLETIAGIRETLK